MLSVTKEVDDTCVYNFITKEWVQIFAQKKVVMSSEHAVNKDYLGQNPYQRASGTNKFIDGRSRKSVSNNSLNLFDSTPAKLPRKVSHDSSYHDHSGSKHKRARSLTKPASAKQYRTTKGTSQSSIDAFADYTDAKLNTTNTTVRRPGSAMTRQRSAMTRYTNKSNISYQERYLSVPSLKPV